MEMTESIKIKIIILQFHRPVKAAQYCLLHMCRQGHTRQITREAHYYIGNHGHHIVFGILQSHPTIKVNRKLAALQAYLLV